MAKVVRRVNCLQGVHGRALPRRAAYDMLVTEVYSEGSTKLCTTRQPNNGAERQRELWNGGRVDTPGIGRRQSLCRYWNEPTSECTVYTR